MANYELDRLSECFDRLMFLQQEISARSINVKPDQCSDEDLQKAVIFCELSGELRQIVLRYRPDLEELNYKGEEPTGIVGRCFGWACSQFKS